MRVERRQGRRVGRIAPRERGRLLDGCGGRAPSVAARGGPARCSRPYSPRVPPACAVGARPPPRCPACRPTALAADAAGAALNLGVFYDAVACRRAPRSIEAASGAAEAGRWAVPQPVAVPAMRVARRQGRGVGAGSRRRSVGRSCQAASGGRHRVRRAAGRTRYACHTRRAYRPHVRWAPARRPAAHVAAQPRSQQTPLARPQTWAFFTRRVTCRRAPRSINPASGAAEAGRWAVPQPQCVPGHARGAPPVPPRGCRIAPLSRGWLLEGCGGRAPSVAARGGPARCRRPYSPRVPPACAVGARPPPRGPCRRPTALAADTAGAAPNLGVLYTAVACRCAPRSIAPASGAAEAGRWAVPQPQRVPAMRVAVPPAPRAWGPDRAAVAWGAS